MEAGKANRYAALQGGRGCRQKVRYVTVERSLISSSIKFCYWLDFEKATLYDVFIW